MINLLGNFDGGAQKRYSTLYNELIKQNNDYFLIVNDVLYNNLYQNNVLNSDKNVLVIRFPSFIKMTKKKTSTLTESSSGKHQPKSNTFKRRLGPFKTFIKMFYLWIVFSIRFRKCIKEQNIKTVYTIFTGGIWAWPLKRVYNFKLIHSYNDSTYRNMKKSIVKFFDSEYWVLKYCDKIDFLSKGLVNGVENITGKIKNERISITPNSFINYSNYYARHPKKDNVLFMGRLHHTKNPGLFMQAIEYLSQQFINFDSTEFLIFGTGPEELLIKRTIKKNKFNNVHFMGVTDDPWKYLQKSKIFVSIQQNENYPSQALLEAMACENAIVASDVGETRSIISDKEGILIPLDKIELANAIIRLLDNQKLIIEFGERARKKAIQEHNIENFKSYFTELMD